jgi:hypothetical protein
LSAGRRLTAAASVTPAVAGKGGTVGGDELKRLLWVSGYYADHYQGWFLGKNIALRLIRNAASDPEAAELLRHNYTAKFGAPGPNALPALADLVRLAFGVVLLLYGPALPFGGYWVEKIRDFILMELEKLPVPQGVRYGSIR